MHQITSLEDLERLLEASAAKPLFILKHSERCQACHVALEVVAKLAGENQAKANFAIVEVRENRSVSDAIAEKAEVKHQSPQLLLFHKGELIWHVNYPDITLQAIEEHL